MDFLNPELWVAVSFLLFVAFVFYLGIPGKIGKALDNRAQAIADELDKARKLREEAEAVLSEYRKRMNNAETEATAILAQAEREAETYVKDARVAFDEMLSRRLSQAELKIKQEEEKARKEIRIQAAELAIAAAEQLIEQKVTGKVAEDMVTDGIERIKKRLH